MSGTYKVRMTVLVMLAAEDDFEATREATQMANDAGLEVLWVEPPELVPPKVLYGSAEEDIYP